MTKNRPDRTLALTSFVVDKSQAGSRGPTRGAKPLHDMTSIGGTKHLWEYVSRLCPHGNDVAGRKDTCRCPFNACDGGPEGWCGEVRTMNNDLGDIYYRGYAVAPWPKKMGRPGMRGVHCGHEHRDYDTALRCAWEVVKDLVFYHEDEP